MDEQRRIKNGNYIRIIPISQKSQDVVVYSREIRVQAKEITFDLPPAGNLGYNVGFTTDKGLEDVIHVYQRFFNETAEVTVREDKSLENLVQFLQVLQQVAARKDLLVHIVQNDWRLPHFWYQDPEELHAHWSDEFPYRKAFAMNVSGYDDELFAAAFALANYPVQQDDKDWIRSIISSPIG